MMRFIEPTFTCSFLFQILFNFLASARFFYWVAYSEKSSKYFKSFLLLWVASREIIKKLDSKLFKNHFLIIFLFSFLLILSPQGDHIFAQFVPIFFLDFCPQGTLLVAMREILQIFPNLIYLLNFVSNFVQFPRVSVLLLLGRLRREILQILSNPLNLFFFFESLREKL